MTYTYPTGGKHIFGHRTQIIKMAHFILDHYNFTYVPKEGRASYYLSVFGPDAPTRPENPEDDWEDSFDVPLFMEFNSRNISAWRMVGGRQIPHCHKKADGKRDWWSTFPWQGARDPDPMVYSRKLMYCIIGPFNNNGILKAIPNPKLLDMLIALDVHPVKGTYIGT